MDNWRTTGKLARSPGSPPGGSIGGPHWLMAAALASVSPPVTSQARRDFYRSVSASIPVLKSHGMSWDMGVGDALGFLPLFDALGDPGSFSGAGPPYQWRIGRAADVVRYDFGVSPVEGGYYEIRDAGVISAQIVMERRAVTRILTEWAGRSFSTADRIGAATAANSIDFSTTPTTEAIFGAYPVKVFSGALSFTRDMTAANFGEDGIATAWDGTLAVDIIGRLNCQLSTPDFLGLLANTPTEKSLTIRFFVGPWRVSIAIPRCICEVSERLLIYQGTYEHTVDFAVIRGSNANLATLTVDVA